MSRAAMSGASREELAGTALRVLAREGKADRVGVWLQSELEVIRSSREPVTFRGLVLDRENESTPEEWGRLSPEAPLPLEVVSGGKSVSVELDGLRDHPVIGPLLGMHRALWVPVLVKGQLRGLLLAATKDRHAESGQNEWENVAAELALAIEHEEERSFARHRHTDLAMVQRTLEGFGSRESPDVELARLVENCTETEKECAHPLAEFAVVGRIRRGSEIDSQQDEVDFNWKSGNLLWTRAIESEPFSTVWRKAVETRRMTGVEPAVPWSRGEVARIVAIPLEASGELTGIFIAGLPKSSESLAALERLELRALLAARALQEKKREEQDARMAEWRETALSGIREAVVLLDARGWIAGMSRGTRELLGEELPGVGALAAYGKFSRIFRDRHRERVNSWVEQPRAGGVERSPQVLDAELGNGVLVHILCAEERRSGEFTSLRLEPVVAAKETVLSLRAETELHHVLGWLEEGVVIFDAQEKIRAMNRPFAQIAGFAPDEAGELRTLEELVTKISRQVADPEHFARKWRELARGNAGGAREELEIGLSSPRVVERASRPILDETGRRLGRVEIYRDLTVRRLFQTKLLRTERLAAMGQMVSGVAHELSNPLTTILGYAQRMLLREESSGNANAVETRQIFHEAERAAKILRQLLLSSRESTPERGRVSLNRVVLRTMEMQRFSQEAETIRVELDLDPLLPYIWGDAGQLQQVLVNLVTNARQAIEQSGKSGVIRVRTKHTPGHRVLLEVSDDGPGIPEAIAARIFDPFFTTKAVGLGTGLGLSVVLGIVREHGGQMNVVSPPGGGTKFSIEWRVMPSSLPGPPQESVALSERLAAPSREMNWRQEGSGDFARARVLVVEDEPTVARLIADVLEDEGHTVDVMLNGREALERASGESYDLAICDMKMPGLDGRHFFKALQLAENPLRERLLFVTGDVISPHTREFLERNQLPHVAKPFRVEELSEAVRSLLSGKAKPPDAHAPAMRKQVARNG